MLFDDVLSLNDLISCCRYSKNISNGSQDLKFHDDQDPEIDKWLHGSPMMPEPLYLYGVVDSSKDCNDDDELIYEDAAVLSEKKIRDNSSRIPQYFIRNNSSIYDNNDAFAPQSYSNNSETTVSKKSALTKVLTENISSLKGFSISEKGNIPLTIYLPNCESMIVMVYDHNTFNDLILRILMKHKKLSLQPPLVYDNPQLYELRMHEGDGDPDMDFAALDRKKKIKNHNENEYCLCVVKGANAAAIAAMRSSPLLIQKTIEAPSTRNLMQNDNKIKVLLPRVGETIMTFDDTTTFKDILPILAQKFKLRILTEEYIFTITKDDQSKYMLMTNTIDLNTNIKLLGVREFEVHRKVYADDTDNAKPRENQEDASYEEKQSNGAIVINETTAHVYKQWNVVKTNKYRQKQERILGVDGDKVYNGKRLNANDTQKGNVRRAEREIKHVRKVEVVKGDPRSFKITWEQEREVIVIDYTCDNDRDCAEIVAKISYLRRKWS